MELICKITDKDILGTNGLSNAEPRYTARAVLKNDKGLYAVMYTEKFDLYSLPGGGIEGGEDELKALRREVLEETGCICESIEEIGCVYENRAHCDYTQYSYYYFVKAESNVKSQHFTDIEIQNKTQVQWYSLEKVIDLIFNQKPSTNQQKFLQARDITALKKYIASINDNYNFSKRRIYMDNEKDNVCDFIDSLSAERRAEIDAILKKTEEELKRNGLKGTMSEEEFKKRRAEAWNGSSSI